MGIELEEIITIEKQSGEFENEILDETNIRHLSQNSSWASGIFSFLPWWMPFAILMILVIILKHCFNKVSLNNPNPIIINPPSNTYSRATYSQRPPLPCRNTNI